MNTDNNEPDPEMELVMPFVTVASVGGPHDDDAYVAGYEMGQLDARLAVLKSFASEPALTIGIREENRAQADLLAMRYGFVMEDECLLTGSDRALVSFVIREVEA